jgi:hypothetical protein
MLSQTSFLPKLLESNVLTKTFIEIFSLVERDESLKALTRDYREIKDDQRKPEFKKKFPSFFPTLWLNSNIHELTIRAIPTGIIQFDMDLKNNLDVDSEEVRTLLIEKIPSLVYLFTSPSGGLKFGIRTDFTKVFNEAYTDDRILLDTKERYRIAYSLAKSLIFQSVPNIVLDDAVGHLKWTCFLSHDPNVFLNIGCETFEVNNRCFCSHSPKEPIYSYATVDYARVDDLLRFIPRDFHWDERLLINCAVFNTMGPVGFDLLYNHWTTDNRVKLRNDLTYQLNHRIHHNIGYLYNKARKYGYPGPATGRARNNLEPRDLLNAVIKTRQSGIPELMNVEEARQKIREELTMFLSDQENSVAHDTLFNISVGLGRTYLVLEFLKRINPTKQVLYLCPDHQLIEEIVERFNQIQVEKAKIGMSFSSCVHFKGKNLMCERPEIVKIYQEAGIESIPPAQCLHDCPLFSGCRYVEQFTNPLANIHLASQEELFNEQAFFNNRRANRAGKEVKIPRRYNFVVIDEDWIKLEENEVEDLKTCHLSIRNILLDCEQGKSLVESIRHHASQLTLEYELAKAENRGSHSIPFENTAQYIKAYFESKKPTSVILKTLYDFVVSEDEDCLKGLRFKADKEKNQVKLVLSRRKEINERFAHVPKLFLDATADEHFIKHISPNIKFVNIMAQKNPATKIYQCQNFVVTKEWLKEEKHREALVKGLKKLIQQKGYKNVGLITYMNLGFEIRNFDDWLAKRVGCPIWGHFGKIRGRNEFDSVDGLLIIGRHAINQETLEDMAYACYGQFEKQEREIVELPVRLVGDQFCTIENNCYPSSELESIYRHYCQAETTQAVGRSRWFNDNPKEVWLFSLESLGMNVEIDGWFRREEWIEFEEKLKGTTQLEEQRTKTSSVMSEVQRNKRLELISSFPDQFEDKKEVFLSLGVTKNCWGYKEQRQMLFTDMKKYGYELAEGMWRRIGTGSKSAAA